MEDTVFVWRQGLYGKSLLYEKPSFQFHRDSKSVLKSKVFSKKELWEYRVSLNTTQLVIKYRRLLFPECPIPNIALRCLTFVELN